LFTTKSNTHGPNGGARENISASFFVGNKEIVTFKCVRVPAAYKGFPKKCSLFNCFFFDLKTSSLIQRDKQTVKNDWHSSANLITFSLLLRFYIIMKLYVGFADRSQFQQNIFPKIKIHKLTVFPHFAVVTQYLYAILLGLVE
jgi:hypothetical protein